MRCPKCNKVYEDSQKVCLRCRYDLVQYNPPNLDAKNLEEAKEELGHIKETMERLNTRLNFIESVLRQGVKPIL